MLLVRKVGIFGVLASCMMLLFGGIFLLDPSGKSDMRQRRVGISRHSLMMISPLFDMSDLVPYMNTSQPASTRIDSEWRLFNMTDDQ